VATEATVIRALDSLLSRDRHGDGTYRVHSLYFDTPDLAVHRRCPIHGRAKLRIRRYDDAPFVFLERKAKDAHGWVDKVRTQVPTVWLQAQSTLLHASLRDAEWFSALLAEGDFAPVRRITCHRTAWEGVVDGCATRVTLDIDIRAAPATNDLVPGPLSTGFKLSDRPLLEVKGDGGFPETLGRMFADFDASPVDFSKYRRSVEVV